MNPNDIQDAKVGTRQVTAIYLGENLVWPTSGALTYVITGAQLHFSRGSALDAGEVNSDYSGNYAWVTGTVVPYRGDEPQTPLSDVMLVPTVTNTTDFVVRDTYYIYGHNLGTTVTSAMKETSVDVTYRTSPSFRVGSTIEQVINQETITAGTPDVHPTVTEEYTDEVPNTRWVSVVLVPFPSNNVCPAYGGSTTLRCNGGHDTARYSRTWWEEITPYTHSFTSGSSYVVPVQTDAGHYPPVQISGTVASVDDDLTNGISLTFSDYPYGGTWATYDYANFLLTIANAGVLPYSNNRSVTVTATNGSASDSATAYQQYNVPEAYDYLIAIAMDLSGDIPGEGGLFSADYESNLVTTYTSGVDTDPEAINATVTTQNCTVEESTVSGSGTLFFNVPENDSTSLSKTVRITLTASGHTAYDEATQEPLPVVVTPTAKVYPDVDTDGRVRVRLAMTQGQFPSGSVVISGMVYHYVLENQGSGTEQTRNISGDITITSDGGAVRLGGSFTWFSGTSGEHWFSATSVSRIGLSNTTFPHEVFDIM